MSTPIESEPTERIQTSCPQCGKPVDPSIGPCVCQEAGEKSQTGSWALVLSGPLSENANTLVLRDELSDSQVSTVEPVDRTGWGRYEILGKLGEGGMGVVYLAQDEELGRKVAIKVLTLADSRPEDLQRFVSEARITSQLSHPNIVPVHEFGTTPDGELFYAMRRVRGRELGQVMDQDNPSMVRRVQMLIDVCNAVEYAHSRGVIHRDIKPENILIGDYGEVLVVDWGLALVMASSRNHPAIDPQASRPRVSNLDEPDGGRLTQWGEVIGTICYMSPEQARGDHHLVGPETDVYATGCILYEMLTHRAPFTFEKNATAREMLIKVVENTPDRPSQIDATVPPDLEAIVIKAMNSQMTGRYRRISQLREDLEAYLEHRPVSAHQAGVLFRLGKLYDRFRGIFVTATVALGLLLLVVGVFAVLQYREREKTHEALLEVKESRDRVAASLRKKDEAVRRQQKAEAAREHERRKRAAREKAEAHLSAGEFLAEHDPTSPKALEEMRAAVKIAPDYHRPHFVLAQTLFVRSRLKEARKAIDICLLLKPGFIPGLWVRVEILEASLERLADAAQRLVLQQLLRKDYQKISTAAPGTAPGHCALGRLALMAGKRAAAARHFQLALEKDPLMPQAQAGLATLFGKQSQQVQKLRDLRSALRKANAFTKKSLNRVLGPWMTGMKPQSQYQRGLTLYRAERFKKALEQFDKAAEGFRKARYQGQELRCRYHVALCYWELDRREEALRLLRRILPRLTKLRDDFAVTVRGKLGLLLLHSGYYPQAVPVLTAAVREYLHQRQLSMAATQSAYLVYSLLMLGEVGLARNKMDVALALTERTGKRERSTLIKWAQAKLLRYENEPEQALALYTELANGLSLRRDPERVLGHRIGIVSCLIQQGDLAAAERLARSIGDIARKRKVPSLQVQAKMKLVEIRRLQGKMNEALELASEISSMGGRLNLQVGIIGYLAGNKAVARRFLKRAQSDDHQPHYARIYLTLMGLRSNGLDNKTRTRYLRAADDDTRWPAPILKYLLGGIEEAALRKAAQAYPVYQMEVAYYLAEQYLANKIQLKAQRLFESCKQARLIGHFEYANSLDRLRQLRR